MEDTHISPKLFKDIQPGQCFSPKNSHVVYIKHSNAVSFDLEGKDHIFSLRDEVFPKFMSGDNYQKMLNHLYNHDQIVNKGI